MPTKLADLPAAVRFSRVLRRAVPGVSLCLLLLGCGEGEPSLVPVSGVVTLDGAPLKDATIEFLPPGGWGSIGRTDDAGRYELLYRARSKGATPGKHTVRISTRIEKDADSTNPEIQKGRKESVPARYNTNSTLEAQVEAGGSGELNFDLTSGRGK